MATDSPDYPTLFDPLTSDELARVLGLTIKRDRVSKRVRFLCQFSVSTSDPK